MKAASRCRLLSRMGPPGAPLGIISINSTTGLGQRSCSGRGHQRISQPDCKARDLQRSNFREMVFIYRYITELSSYLFSNYPFASFCESEMSVSKYICKTILVSEHCPSWDLLCIKAKCGINMIGGALWWRTLGSCSFPGGDGLSSGLVSEPGSHVTFQPKCTSCF